ncbi:hypothetical protein BD309DRAFT_957400 [Dichomitus squalens]|uniref:Uncharacterized protein n=1 Tax=Dichomitus squalens TaxID=114155 RepID=A0A4Q9PKV9_9APHY|nr:hypothetical protein BD309DRAFT_957400 [Dichomitus squalens]TBU54772.1 hypothetical protein BD310DRAFT_935054 [Dichomitus squalens]
MWPAAGLSLRDVVESLWGLDRPTAAIGSLICYLLYGASSPFLRRYIASLAWTSVAIEQASGYRRGTCENKRHEAMKTSSNVSRPGT